MKKDKNIKTIKFIYDSTRLNENNKVLPNMAHVYYEDGTCVATTDRIEIANYKNDLLLQEGKNFKELLNDKAFLCDCTHDKSVLTKEDALFKETLQKNKDMEVRNKKTLRNRIGAGAVATTILLTSLGLGLTACNKKEDKENSENSSYDDMDDLLALIDDDLKKQTVKGMYDFINYSNNDLANKIAVSTDTNKYAYDLDTVIAMDLVFNNYSTKDLARVYDSKKFDTEELNEKMKVCLSKLIPVMLRLNTSSNISNLFKDKESKDFYTKYENKLIDINLASEKEELIKSFFTMFRNDFKEYITEDGIGSNEEHNDKLMGAKVIVASSILPAVMVLSPEKNGTLTNSEDKLLDSKLDSCGYVKKQLEKLDNIKVNVLYDENKNTYKVFTDEEGNVLEFNNKISFSEIYDFIKKDLNLKDEMTTVGFITKDNDIVVGTGKGYASVGGSSKTTTKTYISLEALEKAYGKNSKIVQSAQAQKAEIDAGFAKQNEANRKKAEAEADKKASQIAKDSENAADKKLQDIRDNAAVKDSNGNKKDDYSVVQDNNKDTANGDINISNDNFDGDIYDSNGNLIGKSNSKQNTTTNSSTTKPTTVITDDSKVYGEDEDPFEFNAGASDNVVASSRSVSNNTSRSEAKEKLYALMDELNTYQSSDSNNNSYQLVK